MKYIKNKLLYLFTFLLIASTSCKEELELVPFNGLEPQVALQSLADFNTALVGMYERGGMIGYFADRNAYYYGGHWLSNPDVLADNVIINQEGRKSLQTLYQWQYDSEQSSGFNNMFLAAYGTIQRANLILENVGNLTKEEDQAVVKGEALTMRALCHFDLLRLYGTAIATAGSSDLGVPYVTSTAEALPSRNTVKENYGAIVADLVEASTLIGVSTSVGNDRLNRIGTFALLSRVYLYGEEYQKAIDASTEAINLGASISSAANFPNVWNDGSIDGVIFKVLVAIQDDVQPGTMFNQAAGAGVRSEYNPTFEFYNKFQDSDIRKSTYFSTSDFNGFTFNHIFKYKGGRLAADLTDIKVLRGAEVYLNRAEAYAALDQDGLALADLNLLRSNRYSDHEDGEETGNALKSAIDLERRLELAFEGHRFFDLKRKGLPVVRSATEGDRADGSGTPAPTFAQRMEADDFRMAFPIPQTELDANVNMVQNPGY